MDIVNGSYNIMKKKAIPNAFANGIEGFELFIKNLIKTNNFYYFFFYLTLYLYKGL